MNESSRCVRSVEVPGRCQHLTGRGEALNAAGHDAVHVGDVPRLDAPDVAIFDLATETGRAIVAADTDFGELLVKRHTAEPSLVLFHRQSGRRPAEQAALLLEHLPDVHLDLDRRAVVVLENTRLRVRSLPIRPHGA
ncbi:MAG: DUF5615 family PIN-like protein [Nitriliruptorales bacterium]